MTGDSAADEPLIASAPQPPRRSLTTAQLREAWTEYSCAEREMVTIPLLSNRTPVNPVAVGAFNALAEALRRTGYRARSVWVYNCRNIAQTASGQHPRPSLHAYGLAVDIDPAGTRIATMSAGRSVFSAQPSQGSGSRRSPPE